MKGNVFGSWLSTIPQQLRMFASSDQSQSCKFAHTPPSLDLYSLRSLCAANEQLQCDRCEPADFQFPGRFATVWGRAAMAGQPDALKISNAILFERGSRQLAAHCDDEKFIELNSKFALAITRFMGKTPPNGFFSWEQSSHAFVFELIC